ncbi:WD40-repeat-containing domain protein [Scheffersomyces coipomensis]|uniref:WD40-repeat-containing domain protein n=1 Tax=Scheffersomyces coipomensis TaxID=1788519 RepID=UPI00315DD3EF
MNANTLTIHWHVENMPVYSVAFQPQTGSNLIPNRLVTGGGDNNIRIWKIDHKHIPTNQIDQQPQQLSSSQTKVEYLSTLKKHTQAVNVVRFNHKGHLLATAGDDGTLMIWRLSDKIIKSFEDQGEDEDEDDVESWEVVLQLRSSMSEINDICWSPNDDYIIAGSMDNTVRIYHLDFNGANSKITGKLFISFNNHQHYVQGVSWDPSNQFIATQSSDRSIIIYKIIHDTKDQGKIKSIKYLTKLTKFKNNFMYYPETLQSFFRRLTFSPEGSLLITPCGIDESSSTNSVYVYSRKSLTTSPIFKITGLNKPATVISFNPNLYQLPESKLETSSSQHKLNLPYQMIFAVATQESIIIYNTSDFQPLGYVSNLHYSYITDIAWSPEGDKIIVSSTDGFCSVISFDEGIFGSIYEAPIEKVEEKVNTEVVDPISEPVKEVVLDVEEEKKVEEVSIEPVNVVVPIEVDEVKRDEDNDIIMIDDDAGEQQSNKENINQVPEPIVSKTPTKTIDQFFTKVSDTPSKKDKSKKEWYQP